MANASRDLPWQVWIGDQIWAGLGGSVRVRPGTGESKEDLHRKLGIFILPIVSDWTNVFIVTWLSYAEEELTNSLALAPDWLTKR